jgi:hypothetical protein
MTMRAMASYVLESYWAIICFMRSHMMNKRFVTRMV